MLFNNIIFPQKRPYISPEVIFEEMEGDSMICNSATATGPDVEGGGGGGGNDRPSRGAKESMFILDDEIEDNSGADLDDAIFF